MIKKPFLAFLGIITLMFFILNISAIELEVSQKTITSSYISQIDSPAVYQLVIKNSAENDTFRIYSIAGLYLEPSEEFEIKSGETKNIVVKATPNEAMKKKKGYSTIEYFIENSKKQTQAERITINIVDFEDAVSISCDPINPNTEEIILNIKNNIDYNFTDLKIKSTSDLFDYSGSINLEGFEKKTISAVFDKEKLKSLIAGQYIIKSEIEFMDAKAKLESIVKFLEKEGIETQDFKEGIIIQRYEVVKTNIGNVPINVEIKVEKNILSYLFTTFNIAPEIKLNGIKVSYSWKKELIPNQDLRVVVETNWLWPLLILVLIIVLFVLIKKYVESDLILSKKVSFVKTRGGEFALKVTIRAHAKGYIEKISIVDRLPHLVKLYERFGAVAPDVVDEKNKRLEWKLEALNKGEERIFSYIIYSKIGVVGKFELPSSRAIYEKEGKIKEVTSNRSFFVNEPKK
ncbi:MAG: hypothetical protein ACP5OG_04440 [Candidatus Nanoarchaeia archaeon]